MIPKEKTVVLVTPDGQEQAFEIQHAERLLGMGPNLNGGWAVSKNSKYYYDEKNGIRLKSNKADSAKTK